jgi:hypothetical protein
VKYELTFYIPEGDTLHSHCRENLKSHFMKLCSNSIARTLPNFSLFSRNAVPKSRAFYWHVHSLLNVYRSVCPLHTRALCCLTVVSRPCLALPVSDTSASWRRDAKAGRGSPFYPTRLCYAPFARILSCRAQRVIASCFNAITGNAAVATDGLDGLPTCPCSELTEQWRIILPSVR